MSHVKKDMGETDTENRNGRKTSLSDVQMCLSGRGLSTTHGKGHLFILV